MYIQWPSILFLYTYRCLPLVIDLPVKTNEKFFFFSTAFKVWKKAEEELLTLTSFTDRRRADKTMSIPLPFLLMTCRLCVVCVSSSRLFHGQQLLHARPQKKEVQRRWWIRTSQSVDLHSDSASSLFVKYKYIQRERKRAHALLISSCEEALCQCSCTSSLISPFSIDSHRKGKGKLVIEKNLIKN